MDLTITIIVIRLYCSCGYNSLKIVTNTYCLFGKFDYKIRHASLGMTPISFLRKKSFLLFYFVFLFIRKHEFSCIFTPTLMVLYFKLEIYHTSSNVYVHAYCPCFNPKNIQQVLLSIAPQKVKMFRVVKRLR